MLADHDPGAGGSWMGGRGQAWREGQHGGQPILCKPTPICRPALYASSVHHWATSPFQTLPNILFKRRLLTNGVKSIKGWTLCHRDRKMSTKSSNRQKISNKQGSANIGRPYCLHYKTNVLPVYCYDPKCHYWTMIVQTKNDDDDLIVIPNNLQCTMQSELKTATTTKL